MKRKKPTPERRQLDFERCKSTINDILNFINTEIRINPDKVKSHSRKRHLVQIRSLICYLTFRDFTLSDIGKVLNNRDHSTVIHGLDIYENYKYEKFEIPGYGIITMQEIIDKYNDEKAYFGNLI